MLKNGENVDYKVLEAKENPAETIIEKSGMTSQFTLGEIAVDLNLLQKKHDELESQMRIEEARMINIDRTNPEIGAMSEEMRQVIFIYAKAFAFVKVAKEKLNEIDAQVKEYNEEMEVIQSRLGLSFQTNGNRE